MYLNTNDGGQLPCKKSTLNESFIGEIHIECIDVKKHIYLIEPRKTLGQNQRKMDLDNYINNMNFETKFTFQV